MGDLNNRNSSAHSSREWESAIKVLPGLLLLRAVGKDLSRCLLLLLAVLGFLAFFLVLLDLFSSMHVAFVSKFPFFYKDTSHIGLGPTPNDYFYLIASTKTLSPN